MLYLYSSFHFRDICLDKQREITKCVPTYKDKIIAKHNTIRIAKDKDKDNTINIANDNTTNKLKCVECDTILNSKRSY